MATVLHMDTEAVRAVGQQLAQQAETIRQQAQGLAASVHGMNWQGPGREMLVGEFDQIQQALLQFADQGTALNRRLLVEVDEWERVAASYTGSGVPVSNPNLGALQGSATAPADWWTSMPNALLGLSGNSFKLADFLDGWGTGEDWLGIKELDWLKLKDVAAIPAALSLAFVAGGKYGDTLVTVPGLLKGIGLGPAEIKKIAGVSPSLSHIDLTNVQEHVVKTTAKTVVQPLQIALTCGSQWVEDVQHYKDDPARLASALVTDTTIKMALTASTSTGGAFVGAALGQVLIPIPGAGAAVGGAVGRLAGAWAADVLFDAYHDSTVRTAVIDSAANMTTTTAGSIGQAIDGAVGAVQTVEWPSLPQVRLGF